MERSDWGEAFYAPNHDSRKSFLPGTNKIVCSVMENFLRMEELFNIFISYFIYLLY